MRAGLEPSFVLYLLGPEKVFRGRDLREETTVRIPYLTRDEVNQHGAQDFADEHGVSLDIEACPENISGRQYDAVIYDPDSFPPDERCANLTAVLACPLSRPVAVHSYDISPEQLHLLRRRGAIVARRLGAGVLARLLTAIRDAQRQQTVA
jgi:hypothetical protein